MEQIELERTVRLHRRVGIAIGTAVLGAYFARVFFDGSSCLSPAAEPWGQFGDYVGGVLNPLIAFLALYWLTQSVLIQRKELMETREALAETAKSQSLQAQHAERTVQIGALGSVLDALNADVAAHLHAIESVTKGRVAHGNAVTPEGDHIHSKELSDYVERKRAELKELSERRAVVIAALGKSINLQL